MSAGYSRRGRGEPERDGACRRGNIGLTQADDVALTVDHGTTGVAWRDRCVGLHEVHQRSPGGRGTGQIAVQPRDDACGDSIFEAQRAAQHHGQRPDRGQRLLEGRGRQTLAVGLQDGHVGHLVGGADRRVALLAVGEGHFHLGGTRHDMGVGDDDPVGLVDHAAAQPLLRQHGHHRGFDLAHESGDVPCRFRGRCRCT